MRALFGLVLATACYQPSAPTGAPCSGDGPCPSGQVCTAGRCVLETSGPQVDAATGGTDGATAGGTGARWAAPTLVPGLGSPSDDDDPSWTDDRLTIVFVSARNGNRDLFIGTRATTSASFVVAPLDALNSAADEGSPEISSDGLVIYFTSDRAAAGNHDVYGSFRLGGSWVPPFLVGELTSDADDHDLAISPDGLTALVARQDKLYLATRATSVSLFSAPVVVPSLAVPGISVAAPSITDRADAVYLHAGPVRDLYYARRVGEAYTTPIRITELDTSARESGPFVLAGERNLLFARAGEIYETSR